MKKKREVKLHPDVIAWRAWLNSEDGKNCRAGVAHGEYLKNRLWFAFMAGRSSQIPVQRSKSRKRA
jgi:hypothetical protein